MIFPLGLPLLALLMSSISLAGPVAVTCIRDTQDDPEQIRTLFSQLDRMAIRDLRHAQARFYSADRGFVPIDEFVIRSNFRDGREDAAPLRVRGIRLLQLSGEARPDAFYVVGTTRSAWFDRGSDLHSSYDDLNETWLVGFNGCTIDSVREMSGLYYLLEGVGDG